MPRTRTAIAAIVALTGAAQAGYVINVDTDPGAGFALNPQVTFGGDTTTASQSTAQSGAFGASGGHLFGGNGALEPDAYVFTYSPDAQADNLVIPQGTDLGNGVLASGLAGGGNGAYSVYATWPFTTNVSGGLVNFTVETGIDSFQGLARPEQHGRYLGLPRQHRLRQRGHHRHAIRNEQHLRLDAFRRRPLRTRPHAGHREPAARRGHRGSSTPFGLRWH